MSQTDQPQPEPLETLEALLQELEAFGERAALREPDGAWFSHRQLAHAARALGAGLRALGIGPQDRVAGLIPSGPEAAVAFLGVASHAAYVPLNPGLTAAELRACLEGGRPSACLVLGDTAPGARAVVRALGIPLLEARWEPGRGLSLGPLDMPGGGRCPERVGPSDVALVLHTSGTTARPKPVPLLQRNLAAFIRQGRAVLGLASDDRCLCLLPLYHLAGLATSVLGTWASGGCLEVLSAFSPERFAARCADLRPTWFAGVPPLLEAALAAAPDPSAIGLTELRQIRSSAAPLHPEVMARLEAHFGVPVLEAYGMSETYMIASNPLPPRKRKPGSVGLVVADAVALVDPGGQPVPEGGLGEVVVRGSHVFPGYAEDEEATREAFYGDWFRTGDLGTLDADGYLFLKGRAKDLINQGGQKVSPFEVEEALLAFPGVQGAAAFGTPHPTLGEAVTAAVVGEPGLALGALRTHLAGRLSPAKIPRRILRVPELPLGPLGKVQRRGLAAHFAEALAAPDGWDLEALRPQAEADAQRAEALLLAHPAVAFGAVVPSPSPEGGFFLVALVGLNAPSDPPSLLGFMAGLDPEAVLPTQLFPVQALPRTASGAVDRGLLARTPFPFPGSGQPMDVPDRVVAGLWERLLGVSPVKLHDDFFALGGDSLKAVAMLHEVEALLGVAISPGELFQRPTLFGLVEALHRQSPDAGTALIPVQHGADEPPFFFVHGDFNGGGFHCRRLAREMGPSLTMCSFHPHGLPGRPVPSSLAAMAEEYVPLLRSRQPKGPYFLGGHCNGAVVAYEMARQLEALGEDVASLLMISPPPVTDLGRAFTPEERATMAGIAAADFRRQTPQLRKLMLMEYYRRMLWSYQLRPVRARLDLFLTEADRAKMPEVTLGWGRWSGAATIHRIPGVHLDVFSDHLPALARAMGGALKDCILREGSHHV